MILYTTTEVAGILKISRTKVYELVGKGELVGTRIGGSIRVTDEDLDLFISSCRVLKKRKVSSSVSSCPSLKLRYLRVSSPE